MAEFEFIAGAKAGLRRATMWSPAWRRGGRREDGAPDTAAGDEVRELAGEGLHGFQEAAAAGAIRAAAEKVLAVGAVERK